MIQLNHFSKIISLKIKVLQVAHPMLTFSIIYIVKFEIFFNRKSDHHRCCLFPIDTCVCVCVIQFYLSLLYEQSNRFVLCLFFFRPEIASILILIVIFLLFSSFNSKTLFIYLNKKKRKLFGFFSFVCVDFAFRSCHVVKMLHLQSIK